VKPAVNDPPSGDQAALRREFVRLAQQLGAMAGSAPVSNIEAPDGKFAIDVTETRIPHGQRAAPLYWIATNLDDHASIRETKPADDKWLYLDASTPVRVRITVW